MVTRRSGDELNLLDSSLRTVPGTLVSSGLYAISGVVYAVGAGPAAAGRYLFVTLALGLLVRPVTGVARTLQKRGSERGTDVGAYFGLALLAGVGYVAGLALLGWVTLPVLGRGSLFTAALFLPAVAAGATAVLSDTVKALLGAVGYPSYQSWLGGAEQAIRLSTVVVFAAVIDSAATLLWLTVLVRLLTNVPAAVLVGVVPSVPGREELRRAWSFTRWSVVDQVIDKVAYNMPVYVLGVVGTPVAVGVYEAADRFADFGATVAFALSSPLLTKVSGDWSAGRTEYAYLDAMVTGGTGGTFLVLAYVLANAERVARLAFPGAVAAFSATILLVGAVNVLRAGWTLATHALEGVDRPGTGVVTKVVGLAVAVPPTALLARPTLAAGWLVPVGAVPASPAQTVAATLASVLGAGVPGPAATGALAGALGYVTMNLVVSVGVAGYTYRVFGRLPFDARVAGAFLLGGAAAYLASAATAGVTTGLGGGATAAATTGALAALAVYLVVVTAVSPSARVVVVRAVELSRDRVRATYAALGR